MQLASNVIIIITIYFENIYFFHAKLELKGHPLLSPYIHTYT